MSEAVGDASSARARPCSTRVLVFCSGSGGTGRTTLAAALAGAAIESGLRVRLVDADHATAGLTQLLAADDPELGTALLAQEDFELAIGQAQAALDEPASPDAPGQSTRARALRALLLAVSGGGMHDLVLIDAPAGTGRDSLVLAEAADGWILVVDSSPTGRAQARRFLGAAHDPAAALPRHAWCGVIVNRAPPELDGSDLACLARELGAPVDGVARVGLEVIAHRGLRLHTSVRADHLATRFADDVLRAFDVLLADEEAAWPDEARERWHALVATKARDVARAEARDDLEASVQRKRLDRWPRLAEEHQRLAAELERMRGLQTDELLRHAGQLEDLRMAVRSLRASLDTAHARASARRTRALAAVGLGFAGGALLALIGALSLARVGGWAP